MSAGLFLGSEGGLPLSQNSRRGDPGGTNCWCIIGQMIIETERLILREVDPELGARVLVSLAVGLLMQALFEAHFVDWGEETRESVQLLMDGMVRRSE